MRNERVNRQWRLKRRPEGRVGREDFAWTEAPVESPGDGQVLARTVYMSVDPTHRIWFSDMDQYMPPIELGDVVRGGTFGVVEESAHPDFKSGDWVQGFWGWQDYGLFDPALLRLTRPLAPDVPATAYMAVLGAIGCTAHFGLIEVGQAKAGETVVVSAAAGAVGSLAGQIAKIKGCRVVGICGGGDKARWITEELGFDAAINYREENVLEALRRHCPDGIDVDFENVGGEILDAVLTLINLNARVSLCGLISHYNAFAGGTGPAMFHNILMKRATVRGFIVSDFLPRWPEALAELKGWLLDGRLRYRVDVVDGLENAPDALNRLFDGANTGKQVVKVSDDPSA